MRITIELKNENKKQEIIDVLSHKKFLTYFQSKNGRAYVLIHGAKSGKIGNTINGKHISMERIDLLKRLIPAMDKINTKEIRLICCYNNNTETVEYNGYKMEPAFNFAKNRIFAKFVDNKFVICENIEEF